MKRGRRVLFSLAGCGVLAVVVIRVWPREREPEYGGVKLRDLIASRGWPLARFLPDPEQQALRTAAVSQIGTNALPYLLRWIQCDSSPWRNDLAARAERVSTRVAGMIEDRRSDRANRATWFFYELGPKASPALPELARLLKSSDRRVVQRAIMAVDATGIAGVPLLLDVLTNRQAYVEQDLWPGIMRGLGTNAARVVPVLIDCLKSGESELAWRSAVVLGGMGTETNRVVHALAESTQDTNGRVRYCAVYALRNFSEEARPALPALLRALEDPDESVRDAATGTVSQVAPEILNQAQP